MVYGRQSGRCAPAGGGTLERDIPVRPVVWICAPLRTGRCAGGAAGAPWRFSTVIEVGHIFKLGRKYSEALGAAVLDESGRPAPLVMGSYGIGVGRAMAAVVEVCHDDRGIVWPDRRGAVRGGSSPPCAPTAPEVLEACEALYGGLLAAGVEVLLDDRPERPGVKFTDAELVGIPYRLTVGPRGLESGEAELRSRGGTVNERVALDLAVHRVKELIG